MSAISPGILSARSAAPGPQPRVPVGELLRTWRQRRSLSQLALALDAEVSARHISFVETGRAQPSREMIIKLSDRLEVPLRERNHLLLAGGYAPAYSATPLESEQMRPIRTAIERFLGAHEPYPAVVFDDRYALVSANDAVTTLTDGVASHLLGAGANVLLITLHPEGMAPHIVNLAEWSAHLMHRLHRQAASRGDAALFALHAELAGYPGVVSSSHDAELATEIILPLRLRAAGAPRELSFFSTVSTFGSAQDITVSELTIEAFYPAEATTANHLLSAVGAGPPGD